MLDAFIIEEIRRREKARKERERPSIEIPLPSSDDHPGKESETDDEQKPNVVVIDLMV